jgi:hypothetical protein
MNYPQAREESERLSRMLNRDVEPAPVTCNCDYFQGCYLCQGSGLYYQLVYAFCGHTVQDGDDLECQEADCKHKEYLASVQKEEELETVS